MKKLNISTNRLYVSLKALESLINATLKNSISMKFRNVDDEIDILTINLNLNLK